MGKDLNGKELGKGLSQRKDERYEGRFSYNNKKYSVYSNKLPEVKKLLQKKKEEVMSGNTITHTDVTLFEWFEYWFKTYKLRTIKPTSVGAYRRKFVNTFGKIIGDKPLQKITLDDIQKATNELTDKNYAARTIKDALGVLRPCLDCAVVVGHIKVNPCVGVITPSHEYVEERRVLSTREQELLLEEVSGGFYEELYKYMLLSGLRIGEVGALTVDDINFEEKYVMIDKSLSCQYEDGKKMLIITTPKTRNSFRKIPFFGETEKVLKSQVKKRNELKKRLKGRWRADDELGELLFTTTMGSPITRYLLQSDMNKVVDNINSKLAYEADVNNTSYDPMDSIHPHCLRHTFCTRLLDKNMKPHIVQRILGHANISTTMLYSHALDNTVKQEVESMGNIL